MVDTIISVLGKQKQTDSEQYCHKEPGVSSLFCSVSCIDSPVDSLDHIHEFVFFSVCVCIHKHTCEHKSSVHMEAREQHLGIDSPYTLVSQDLSYFCFCEAYSKLAGLQACGLCSCLCFLTAEIKGVCHNTYWTLVLNGIFLFIINPCNYQLSKELFQQPECLMLS